MAEMLPSDLAIARLTEFLGQSGLGGNLMDAGSLSGTMSSGFSPFLGAAQWAQGRNFRLQDMARRVSEENERTRAATNWLASQSATLNPESRKTASQLLSAAWNHPAVAANFGGSDIDLAFGLQNTVLASGMRVGGSRVQGAGPVSDQLAFDLWKNADQFFFGGGSANLRRTNGFDRTEIGQIFSTMAQRGAFAGMDTRTDLNFDRSTGQFQFGDLSSASAQINEKVADLTAPLRMLKDIVGPKPLGELISLAESLAGISAGAKDAKEVITRTLMDATSSAASLGLNPHTFLNFRGKIIEGYTQLGYAAAPAAAAAQITDVYAHFQAQASREAAARGSYFTPTVSEDKAAAGMMVQMAAMKQDPRMQAYAYAMLIQQNGMAKPGDMAKLDALLGSNSPDESKLLDIVKTVSAYAGSSAENAVAAMPGGMNGLLAALGPTAQLKFSQVSQNVLMNRSLDQHLKANLYEMGAVLSTQFGAANVTPLIELHTGLARKLQGSSYDALTEKMGEGGGADAIRKILQGDAFGRTLNPEALEAMVASISGSTAFASFTPFVRLAMGASNPSGASRLSLGDRMVNAQALTKGVSLFDDRTPTDTSLIGGFMRGFLGKKTSTDNTELDIALMQRDRAILTARGAVPTDKETMQAWRDSAVSDRGMWNGLGRFNLDLATSGTPEEQARQMEIIRAIYADANPKAKSAQIDKQAMAALQRLQGGGEDGFGEYQNLIMLARSGGGTAREVGGRSGIFDFLSAAAKKPLDAFTAAGATNLAVYELMGNLQLLSKDDRERFDAAAKSLDAEGMSKLSASDEQLKATAEAMTKGDNFTTYRGDWERMIRVGGLGEKYAPILTGLRQQALTAAEKAKDAQGKLTDEGKAWKTKAQQYGDLLDSGGSGGLSGRILTISNLGQAVMEFIDRQVEVSRSSTPTR